MKFKDVTKQRPDIVHYLINILKNDTVKVFERGGTRVIFSSNFQEDHASVSNPYRQINEKEIKFVISILKTAPENITMSHGNLGVTHFCHYKSKQKVN